MEHQALRPFFPPAATLRKELGLPMPGEIANTRKQKPVFDLSKLPPSLPPPVRSNTYWAEHPEAIIDALCDYLDTVAARNVRQPTQADYRKAQKGRREWPAPATLGRVGEKSFTAWIAKAQKEWQQRRKRAA
jgi:hypothetical protein